MSTLVHIHPHRSVFIRVQMNPGQGVPFSSFVLLFLSQRCISTHWFHMQFTELPVQLLYVGVRAFSCHLLSESGPGCSSIHRSAALTPIFWKWCLSSLRGLSCTWVLSVEVAPSAITAVCNIIRKHSAAVLQPEYCNHSTATLKYTSQYF